MRRASAALLLRPEPAFRIEAFASGFEKEGFSVTFKPERKPQAGDVVVLWNRYPQREHIARSYEDAGARVLIAENGYLGREWRGGIWYALSLGHHNGAGTWPDLGPERWDGWGVPLSSWRDDGEEIVVLAQRGFGHPKVREPRGWPTQAASRARGWGKRVRIRQHPGETGKGCLLADDLRHAWCCVTWGSGAALKALAMGVPVFHGFPRWIGAAAARPFSDPMHEPFRGDRLPMFRRMAWAMWNLEELASGEAFRCVLK